MLRAASDANVSINNRDIDGTFYGVQNLLNAGANISKALWGQGGKLSSDRQELRDSIGVDDDSPLREVTMRNHYEHFDERLDQWWQKSANHNHVDRNFYPHSAIANFDDLDNFRNLDPATNILTFWGQDFNLESLVTEVRRILPKLKAEAGKPHWVK